MRATAHRGLAATPREKMAPPGGQDGAAIAPWRRKARRTPPPEGDRAGVPTLPSAGAPQPQALPRQPSGCPKIVGTALCRPVSAVLLPSLYASGSAGPEPRRRLRRAVPSRFPSTANMCQQRHVCQFRFCSSWFEHEELLINFVDTGFTGIRLVVTFIPSSV